MIEQLKPDIEARMSKAVESLKSDLSKVRTGRASPALLENIKVDYYGTPTPIKQIGQISVPDAKTLQIASWDQGAIPLLEKAIIAANIGLTPNVDGKTIRLNIPPLTEERRKDISKSVKQLGEDTKVAIRNIRRDANDTIKGDKDLPEDDSKRAAAEVQKITDGYVENVDKLVESKIKDVMTV
ncbi:ribosome recycling factor [bacterium]|nr:ribosome recycling factor [bacterium]